MAERVVKVTLAANVNSYLAGMKQAQDSTDKVQSASAKVAQKLAEQKQAFELVGRGMVAGGAVIGAGVAFAVARFAEFDQAMSNVKATGADAAASIKELRDAALDAGAKTVFSATESANAVEELAKAGVSSADILGGGLTGALSLAAAGGLGVADAAGIAATALQVFGLKGTDMSHVADLLAAGAGKAMGDVTDLSQALAQGGQVAASTGLSIEETTATLSAFASQGLLGSDAGTSFKTMLQRLTPQSEQAKKEMDRLGISAYDAQGQFIGMAKFAGNLQTAMKDLTPEQRNASQSIIFGSDAVRASNILYKEGEKGIQDWISAVDDTGYAAKTAATRLDNLKGDWEQLTGAIDSAMIASGEASNGPLRGLVQGLTGLVDVFNGLPDGGQQAVFWIGAASAAALTAGGVYLLAIPKIAAYEAALKTLGPTAQRTGAALGFLAKTAGILSVAAVAVGGFDKLEQMLHDRLLPTTTELTNAITTAQTAKDLFDKTLVVEDHFNAKPIIADVNELRDVLKTASAEGDNLFTWLNANTAFTAEGAKFNEFRGQWQKLAKELADTPDKIVPTFQKMRTEFGLNSDQISTLIELSPELKTALTEQATQAGVAADSQSLLSFAIGGVIAANAQGSSSASQNADALKTLQGQTKDTQKSVDDLADTIRNFGKATLNTRDANRQFEAAFDDLTQSVKDNGTTLDIGTEKGRNNEAALDDLAKKALEVSAATYTQTGSQQAANDAIANGRQRLIDSLGQFGINGQAAQDYADKLGLIPGNIPTVIALSGIDDANQKLNTMYQLVQGMNGKTLRLNVATDSLSLTGRANGGILPGAPSSRDNILIHAATGEFVTNARATAVPVNRAALEYMNNGGTITGFPGYANGGIVQYASTSTTSAAPSIIMPSLDGMSISGRLEIGGDGLARIVDGRISAASRDRAVQLSTGKWGDA